MRYIEIFIKHALSRSKLQHTDYALNPYKGCEHRCVYCYSPYVLHIPLDEWNSRVYVKRNLPTVLDKELKRKKGHVEIGTVTDAYQPVEKKYEITRHSLEILKKHGVSITILTKSSLILRDIDILKNMNAEVGVTITTLDNEIQKKIEPYASKVDERFNVLEELSEDVKTYAFIGPIFPYFILEDMREILIKLKKLNVSYVIFDKFRMKKNMIIPNFLNSKIPRDYTYVKRKIKKIAKEVGISYTLEF